MCFYKVIKGLLSHYSGFLAVKFSELKITCELLFFLRVYVSIEENILGFSEIKTNLHAHVDHHMQISHRAKD